MKTYDLTTVYLAGPMRGIELFNFPAFHDAAKMLRQQGLVVLSPAEHDLETGFDPATDTEEDFDLYAAMRWDIQAVLQSDAIVLLSGWRHSSGTATELVVAEAIGIPWLEYPSLRTPTPETAVEEAYRLVHGPRQASYGHPFDDFTRTGRMWGAILGIDDIHPAQVGLCMAAVKISREVNAPKRDNLTDLAGYAETVDLVRQREQSG